MNGVLNAIRDLNFIVLSYDIFRSFLGFLYPWIEMALDTPFVPDGLRWKFCARGVKEFIKTDFSYIQK